MEKYQGTNFWSKTFTTRQSLKMKIYNESYFELKSSQRVKYSFKDFKTCQTLNLEEKFQKLKGWLHSKTYIFNRFNRLKRHILHFACFIESMHLI